MNSRENVIFKNLALQVQDFLFLVRICSFVFEYLSRQKKTKFQTWWLLMGMMKDLRL